MSGPPSVLPEGPAPLLPPLPSPADNGVRNVNLSLVSHTNVGKTSLARTLLGRDIGEVRDAAHVTAQAEAHELVRSNAGDRLLLWDTPGFGDSQRLAQRLLRVGQPLGWLLTEVWDRWRDRGFWAAQHAVRHVLEQADVVLYLVNASEPPEDAGYLAPELQVLGWAGKPVIAVLNQVGPGAPALLAEAAGPAAVGSAGSTAGRSDPSASGFGEGPGPGAALHDDAPEQARLVRRWQAALARYPAVRGVLTLDAFSRCWVHEGVLWRAVAGQLPEPLRPAFGRLQAQWTQAQQRRLQRAMDELSRRLARAALDREPIQPPQGWRGRVGAWMPFLGKRGDDALSPTERAMAALAERLDADVRDSTATLIALHGLDGEAGREVLTRLARHYAVRQPLDQGRAALWGGLVTGALAGLKADLASGGLTMGGGLLAGGVLGALSAAGAAHGVNRLRGLDAPEVAWADPVLDMLLANALLGYLAVAHHGRGRGAWVATEPPRAWTDSVAAITQAHSAAYSALWRRRQALIVGEVPGVDNPSLLAWQADLQRQVGRSGEALLRQLYPQAAW